MRIAILTVLLVAPIDAQVTMQGKPFSPPEKRVAKSDSGLNAQKPATAQQDQKATTNKGAALSEQPKTVDQRPETKEADKDIARYTGWLVIVAFLQCLVLAGSVWAIIHQASAMKKSERAWLMAEPRFNKLDQAPPNGAAIILYVCSLKNTGQTPARIAQTGLAFRRIDKLENLPKEPVYIAQEILDAGHSLLIPGDEFALTTLVQPAMTTTEYVSFRNKQVFLYSYGFVKYLDVFGKKREFRFCHYYHVPVPGEAQVEGFQRLVSAPPKYNRAT